MRWVGRESMQRRSSKPRLRRILSRLTVLSTADISKIGVDGVVKSILDRVGKNPVYITLDIDVVDPSYAPATGSKLRSL